VRPFCLVPMGNAGGPAGPGLPFSAPEACVDRPAESQIVDLRDRLEEIEILLDKLSGLQCKATRLLLTPEERRASDCCGTLIDFPEGKDVPTCGGGVAPSPHLESMTPDPRLHVPDLD